MRNTESDLEPIAMDWRKVVRTEIDYKKCSANDFSLMLDLLIEHQNTSSNGETNSIEEILKIRTAETIQTTTSCEAKIRTTL